VDKESLSSIGFLVQGTRVHNKGKAKGIVNLVGRVVFNLCGSGVQGPAKVGLVDHRQTFPDVIKPDPILHFLVSGLARREGEVAAEEQDEEAHNLAVASEGVPVPPSEGTAVFHGLEGLLA